MARIKINNEIIETNGTASVMQLAKQAGYEIPAMCHLEGSEPVTSCMLCVVRDVSTGKLLPSCSLKPREGLEVITDDEEIFDFRKTSLDLLLSDHVGDCEAPCQIACPAHMDIAEMNRLLAEEKIDEALEIVRRDIALPSVLGRICPAPCEGACRRKPIDGPISICVLKRYAGDFGVMAKDETAVKITSDKEVAIIGSGPAGLSAAYYLQLKGIACTIFDKNEKAGGNLRYAIPTQRLSEDVLDREIEYIKKTGVIFNQNTSIDHNSFKAISEKYDAIIIATGDYYQELNDWGINNDGKHILVNKETFQTNIPHVFAIGNILKSKKYAIISLGHGKDAAQSVEQFLTDADIIGNPRIFNSRFGRLKEEEFFEYLKEAENEQPALPAGGKEHGFSKEEMILEAKRCLHCDCRKLNTCKLRLYADKYNADQKRFGSGDRKPVQKEIHHDAVVYEPQKCIKCGICIRITENHKEALGLTFIGRGFDVEVGVPFDKKLSRGLTKTAKIVVSECPTGALCLRKNTVRDAGK